MMITFIESPVSIHIKRIRFFGISKVEWPLLASIPVLLYNGQVDAVCCRKHMSPTGHTTVFSTLVVGMDLGECGQMKLYAIDNFLSNSCYYIFHGYLE